MSSDPKSAVDRGLRGEQVSSRSGPIAIVIARAGGEQLQRVVDELPRVTGAGYVIYLLPEVGVGAPPAELPPSRSGLPVVNAAPGQQILARQVLVVSGVSPWVFDGAELALATDERARKAPLNAFLTSVAQEHGDVIVLVLASAEGDGAHGLSAVRAAGGVVLGEQELSKEGEEHDAVVFDRLVPRAEIASSLASQLGELRQEKTTSLRAELSEEAEPHVQRILNSVRVKTGHDFRQYKSKTIVRRIQRRLQISQVGSFEAYSEHVRDTPGEAGLLLQDLLIGVTQFFRDPELFELLAKAVIPKLLLQKAPGSTVRVWVAGCASGEEAYSIALLLVDHIDRSGADVKIQIFATDIDERALRIARRGSYPRAIEADVPPDLLSRYLIRSDRAYQVSKRIRECVIFSTHNLIADPPFFRLDLLSCRNLLIYLSAELQSRLAPLFHYALLPEGYLLLGPAEGLGSDGNLFSVVEKKQRVFQRREIPRGTPSQVQFPRASRREEEPRALRLAGSPAPPLPSVIERVLLESYAPACVVVDEKLDIAYFQGKTGRYLQPPEGRPTVNLLEMARPGLRSQLRACVYDAIMEHRAAARDGVEVKTESGFQCLRLAARPLHEAGRDGLYLVTFQEDARGATSEPAQRELEPAADPALAELDLELQRTRAQLSAMGLEFQTSSEELTGSNEELLSMNEELQSSNEELETTREELQSVNEELETVNSELNAKLDELGHANSDLRNLFESTRIATLFLDNELRIKNFTPSTTALFSLIATDRGRPIGDIAQRFDYRHLARDVRQVILSLHPYEAQVQSFSGAWFMLRILPYQSIESVIEGAVVTFTDVSALKRAELEVQRLGVAHETQLRWLKALMDVVPVGIAYYEKGMRGVHINQPAVQVLQVPKDYLRAESALLSYVAWPEGGARAEQAQLLSAITSEAPAQDVEIALGAGAEARHLVLNSAPLIDASQTTYGQVSAIWDITESKRARELALARERQQSVIAELGLRALAHRDMEAFLEEGLTMLARAVQADACDLLQLTEGKNALRSLCRIGWKQTEPGLTEELVEDSPAARALQGDAVLYQRSVGEGTWPRYLEDEGIESGVRLAISLRDREAFGLLGLYKRSQHEFSKQELDFLRTGTLVITSAIQRHIIEEARLRERDLAAMRRSEEQLRRAERLASLGTFATGIAHELNNPLNNISLASDYAEQTQNDERRKKLLTSIKNNAQRAGQIVQTVLRFARDEVTDHAAVDLATVLRRSVDFIRAEFKPERLTVKLDLDDTLPKTCGNATELEQVFVNLLRNAAEAHPGHCHARILAKLAESSLRVSVADDGPGIPEADLPQVFDPFFSTRRKQGGTGLGLSISHRIVTAHGGTIRVASAPGQGTIVSIELPLAAQG